MKLQLGHLGGQMMQGCNLGDPTGLVPVVKKVEEKWTLHLATFASTGARPVGSMKLQVAPRIIFINILRLTIGM